MVSVHTYSLNLVHTNNLPRWIGGLWVLYVSIIIIMLIILTGSLTIIHVRAALRWLIKIAMWKKTNLSQSRRLK